MNYYPVFLNLKGRRVLVIGAGVVALQKITALLDHQADVCVVAPGALPAVERLARDGKITWIRRAYRWSDLKGARLVIAATDDPALQKKVAASARVKGLWVNVVDVPPLCDFIAPAVVRRGDIQIAISTGGAAPALAKHLRKKLDALIGREYADFAAVVKALRPTILKLPKDQRLFFWRKAVSEKFFKEIRRNGIARAAARMKEWMNAR